MPRLKWLSSSSSWFCLCLSNSSWKFLCNLWLESQTMQTTHSYFPPWVIMNLGNSSYVVQQYVIQSDKIPKVLVKFSERCKQLIKVMYITMCCYNWLNRRNGQLLKTTISYWVSVSSQCTSQGPISGRCMELHTTPASCWGINTGSSDFVNHLASRLHSCLDAIWI
jgi:hypothetical protein